MSNRLILLTGFAVALTFCAPLHGQGSPSLGDLARQARKDKSDSAPQKVFTNDDLPSTGSSSALGLGAMADPKAFSNPGGADSPQAAIEKMEMAMKMLDSLDRPSLVKVALQGANSDFPGHAAWEDKLWEAKKAYVARGKELSQRAKQILSDSQSLQSSPGAQSLKSDDPKVQELSSRLKIFVRDAVQADAAFKAVMMEGADLAKQSSAH